MAKQAKVLTAGDIRLALAIADTPRNKCLMMLSVLCGLRAIECANLTIGSVMNANGKVMDRITLAKHQTKGARARSIHISTKCAKYLADYLDSLPPRRKESHRPLFISQKTNDKFSAHGVVMWFQRLYRAAGIAGASSHSGRRTFATRLADKGVSVFVLKKLMGHSSISTTSAYVDVNDSTLANAVNLL